MTASEIIDALGELHISSERKSLYDDISLLQMYGLDIKKDKVKHNKILRMLKRF